MAISPTALASANTTGLAAPNTSAAKLPIVPIVLAVAGSVLVATAAVASGMYFLARSGRLPGVTTTPHRAELVVPPTSHIVPLEPLLVNLADQSGTAYARISLALRVADSSSKTGSSEGEKAKGVSLQPEIIVPVRDTVLTVLGKETADELLAPEGKNQLRMVLKTELAERNPALNLKEVYLTDLLIQR